MLLTLLQQPFLGPDNALHPDAAWYPVGLSLDNLPAEAAASIPWRVFHNAASFALGAQGDGDHLTHLGTAAYLQMAVFPAASQGEGLMSHLTRAMVGAAMTTLDTDTGQKDAQGNPVMASAFAQAAIITLDTDTGAVTVVQAAPAK